MTENVNQPSTQNEQQQNAANNKKNLDLKNEFLKKFLKNLSPEEFKNIFNIISNEAGSSVSGEIKEKLTKFKAKTAINEKYWSLKIDEFDKFDIFREIMKEGWTKLETRRKSLENQICNLYKITEKVKLENKIKELSLDKVQELSEKETSRDEFLKGIFKNNIPEKKKISDAFKWIENLDYESLSKEEKDTLEWFVAWWYATSTLLKIIKDKFTPEQKKALLKAFVWSLTLEQLYWIDWWTWGIFEGKKEKFKEILEQKTTAILKSYWMADDKIAENLDEAVWYIKPADISIPIDEIDGLDEAGIVDKIIDENRLESWFKNAREQGWVEEDKTRIKTKEEFYKKLEEIDIKINWIKNLQEWDVIKWAFKSNENDTISYIYLKIDKIDDDWISIKEISYPTWDKVYSNFDKIKSRKSSFNEFLDFLGEIWTWSELIKKNSFEEKLKNEEIKALPKQDEIKNEIDLKKLIDEFDSSWMKYWLEEGTTFEFVWTKDEKGKGSEIAIASITKIDSKSITIRSKWEETFPLDKFFEMFKWSESKRIAKLKDNSGLLTALQWNDNIKWFKDLEWDEKDKNKLIYSPQKENKDFPSINLFVNKKNECLVIDKIHSNWYFDVKIGKYEEKSEEVWKDKKIKKTKNFKWMAKSKLSRELFYAYVKKNDLDPKIDKDAIEATEKINNEKMPQKSSIWETAFQLHNFASILAWGKQFFDNIKHSLKANQDLQAAEVALMFGKVLPESLRTESQAKVDWANKKRMNDKITQLEDLSPPKQMEHIRTRLEIANLPRYELEALLIFVMRKNWCLYPTDLKWYSWSYFWFKRLAWLSQDYDIRNHEIYKKISKDKTKNNLSFTEEEMILELLWKQWDLWITRSSFKWEFETSFKEAQPKQREGWADECKNKYSTIEDKVNFAVKERLKNWRYIQALWALEPIFEKWWSAAQLNHAPFIFLASWILRTSDNSHSCITFRNLWNKWKEPMLLFWADTAKMDIFDKIFVKFSYEIDENAWKMADNIISMRKSWKSQQKIIAECDNFWKKYGDKIVYKFNTTDDDFLLKEKEEWWVYKEYADWWKAFLSDPRYTEDEMKNDLCDANRNVFNLWWHVFLSKNLWSLSGQKTLQEWTAPKKVFDSLIKKIDDIKDASDEKKFKLYKARNIEIILWNLDNRTSFEQLNSTTWWADLTKRVWIPNNEQKDVLVHDREWLINWAYDRNIEAAFKKFKEGEPVFESNIKNVLDKTNKSYQDVLNSAAQPKPPINKFKKNIIKNPEVEEEEDEEFREAA